MPADRRSPEAAPAARTLSSTHAAQPPASSTLHIGQLSLNVPGVSADSGQRLARRVSSLVATRIPEGLAGRIDRLSLDVRQPARGGEAALARAVADAIVRAAGRAKGAF